MKTTKAIDDATILKMEYENICSIFKKKILTIITDIMKSIDTKSIYFEKEDYVSIDEDDKICGVEIIDDDLFIVFKEKDCMVYDEIFENQIDETYLKFDSNIENWFSLLKTVQKEYKKLF